MLPIYAALPPEQQMAVSTRSGGAFWLMCVCAFSREGGWEGIHAALPPEQLMAVSLRRSGIF